jgi:hypothetical protein
MTYYDSIDAKPETIDWSDEWDAGTDLPRWDSVPPEFETVAAARTWLEHVRGDLTELEDIDEDDPEGASAAAWEAAQYNDPDIGCPMMNYAYPLDPQPDDAGRAAALLGDLPVEIILLGENQHEGRYVLALSGGGMDLSWEICEAYRLLDYHPPTHFMNRLRMAGPAEAWKHRTLTACIASATVAETRAAGLVEDLNRLREAAATGVQS